MTAVDESPSPSLLPPPRSPRTPLFGFGEPTPGSQPPSPPPSPTPSPEPGTPQSQLPGDPAPDSGDESAEDDSPSASPAGTSSRGSTRVANPLNANALRDTFRGGVLIAGDQAHTYLARTEGQQAVGLYKADDEDAERIGDPLARLAGRHQGLGEVNEDTADLLAAMVGLTRYATKQIQRGRDAKTIDATPQRAPEPVDL